MIIAGQQSNPTSPVAKEWQACIDQKRVFIFNHFITQEEQQLLFSAADWVILPFIHHKTPPPSKTNSLLPKILQFLRFYRKRENQEGSGIFTPFNPIQ